jgi:hypothetical protein
MVKQSMVTITGGYNTRGEAGRSIQYNDGGTSRTFLEVDKNAAWFLKGVGGPKVQKGDLKAVVVITMLRKLFASHLCGDPDESTAVAEGHGSASICPDTAPGDEIDPMDAMDDLPDVVPDLAKKPAKKKAKIGDQQRAVVVDIDVPTRPPCAGCDGDNTTVISMYRQPQKDRRTNGNLYLRVDCVEWLLSYAADELHFQGVTPSSPPPSGHHAGNCTAVADFYVEWDFLAKEWEGTFVAGSLAGTKHRMCGKAIDKAKWDKLKEQSLVHGTLDGASLVQRKNAVKEIMILWGADTARNFHTMGGSVATSTPERKEKRPLEETAVAAE